MGGCTPAHAVWCPTCGDCACPDVTGCPLHAPGSAHGEVRALAPTGLPVTDEDDPGWPVVCPACDNDAFRITDDPVLGSPTLGVVQVGRHGQVVAYSGALRCTDCGRILDDPGSAAPAPTE